MVFIEFLGRAVAHVKTGAFLNTIYLLKQYLKMLKNQSNNLYMCFYFRSHNYTVTIIILTVEGEIEGKRGEEFIRIFVDWTKLSDHNLSLPMHNALELGGINTKISL